MTEFKSDEAMNGYPPIEDHGLIGNGATAALVGLDGAIDWLCVPVLIRSRYFAACWLAGVVWH